MFQYHWLPIEQRIIFKNLCFVFKSIHGIAPIEISNMINIRDISNYSLQGIILKESDFHPKSKIGQRAFSFHAPRLWNSLPLEIRISTNEDLFKKKLKSFLLSKFDDFKQSVNRVIQII